jgi:hypothetical protein
MINGMQTGHVNLRVFAPRMRRVILTQTNGTLVYPQLARLGAPVGIHLVAERQLPRGVIYGLRADFAQASVNWELAFDRANIIEAFSFKFVASGVAPGVPQQQYPQPPPPQQQTTTPLFSAPLPVPQQQAASQPAPAQTRPPPTQSSGGMARPSSGTSTSGATDDACKLYPNLC